MESGLFLKLNKKLLDLDNLKANNIYDINDVRFSAIVLIEKILDSFAYSICFFEEVQKMQNPLLTAIFNDFSRLPSLEINYRSILNGSLIIRSWSAIESEVTDLFEKSSIFENHEKEKLYNVDFDKVIRKLNLTDKNDK